MANEKPNIFDVARLAGVSKSTVSRVTHADPKVAPQTRDKVQRAIEELGYVPVQAAQSLRTGGTPAIGLLISAIDIPIFGVLQMQLDKRLGELGYYILQAVVTGPDVVKQRQHLQKMRSMQVKGIIVACGSFNTELLEEYAQFMTIVVVGRPERSPELHNVAYDESRNGRLLAAQLFEAGHRDIMVQTISPVRSLGSSVRSRSAIAHAQELGMRPQVVDIADIDNYQQFLVDLLETEVTALVCIYDEVAIQTWRVLKNLGKSIPQDLSFTGTDGVSSAVELLGITTIEHPVREIASRSADLIAGLIDGSIDSDVPQRITLVGAIREGETVKRLN